LFPAEVYKIATYLAVNVVEKPCEVFLVMITVTANSEKYGAVH
jgi:hypothetical protein